MGGVKARCAGSLGEKRVKGITDPRSLPGPRPPTEVDRAGAGAQAKPYVR
jgi:hypothetical protein